MIRNQFGRRNLSSFQRASLALEMKPMLAEIAKENQIRKPVDSVLQNSAKQNTDTRKELAKEAGVSHDTISKNKVLVKGVILGNQTNLDEARLLSNATTKEQAAKFPDVVLPTVLQFRNQGDTLPVIADKLNNMGVKTRRGGKWYASTVTNILKRA